jgi:putative tricarboxylic transport membrane protein
VSRTEPHPLTTGALRVQRMPRWYTGRSELVVVAGVYALAIAFTAGILTMDVPEGTAFPGPTFFPTLVVVFLYAVGTALAIEVLRPRRRRHVADDPVEISDHMLQDLGGLDATSEIRVVSPEEQRPSPGDSAGETGGSGVDVKTVLLTVGALAAFILVLPLAGWLLSAAALFWVIAWAFGSRRPLMDIAIGVIMSSTVQLAFGAGLGLSLPAGFLEGVL